MKRCLSLLLALCLFCAIPAPAWAAGSTEPEKPRLRAVSMRLSSDFGMVFTLEVPAGTTEAGVYVGDEKISGKATANAGEYTASFFHIRAWEMTVVYNVTPYAKTANGEILGDTRDLSVLDYATGMMASPACTPALRELLVSMLNYGAAAQALVGFNTARPANMNLSSADRWRFDTERPFPTELTRIGEATTAAAELTGATLVLSEKVYLKVFISVAGQEKLRCNGGTGLPECAAYSFAEEAAFLARHLRLEVATDPSFADARSFPLEKCGLSADTVTAGSRNDGYFVKVPYGLFPTEYGQTFYFRVRAEDGVGYTFPYSAELYVGRTLLTLAKETEANGGKQTAANRRTERVARALIAFGDAVRAYETQTESR